MLFAMLSKTVSCFHLHKIIAAQTLKFEHPTKVLLTMCLYSVKLALSVLLPSFDGAVTLNL